VSPSLQLVLFASFAVQLSLVSLQEPEQSLSVVLSGRHGLPAWLKQTPDALHVSLPLQKRLSLHGVRFASFAVQLSLVSLQLSLQAGPALWPGHGLPAWVEQAPDVHESAPLQNSRRCSRWHWDRLPYNCRSSRCTTRRSSRPS
jgi:hypothetical protein